MVEHLCGQCEGAIELPEGEYGEYSCPHCDADFEYENVVRCYACQTEIKLSSGYDGEWVHCPNCRSKFSVASQGSSVSDALARTGPDHSVNMSIWLLFGTILPPVIFVSLFAMGLSLEWSCGIVSLLGLGVVAYGFAFKDIGAASGMIGFGVGGGISATIIGIILVILAILWFILEAFFGFFSVCGGMI